MGLIKINGKIYGGASVIASDIIYNNEHSSLKTTTVQKAIDDLDSLKASKVNPTLTFNFANGTSVDFRKSGDSSSGEAISLVSTDENGNKNYYNLLTDAGVYLPAKNKILWQGGYYMSSTHNITLSERISAQPKGIVLIFSYYGSGAVGDYWFSSHFVPKQYVAAKGGTGINFIVSGSKFAKIGTKYLYIKDTTISGHDDNTATGTANGITYANNSFVLRYVIGV